MAITRRQREVYDFISRFVAENGYSPSYEEIGEGLNLNSLATVHKHISVLEAKNYLKRGFNQSRLLAECVVAAADGGAEVQSLLRRVVNTASQTNYDRAARQENLKNAFALAPGATINPGQRYILVDDVFTTGSTLNSCATVLRRGGALSLDVVTFGHG